jgi:hypothetical protein
VARPRASRQAAINSRLSYCDERQPQGHGVVRTATPSVADETGGVLPGVTVDLHSYGMETTAVTSEPVTSAWHRERHWWQARIADEMNAADAPDRAKSPTQHEKFLSLHPEMPEWWMRRTTEP